VVLSRMGFSEGMSDLRSSGTTSFGTGDQAPAVQRIRYRACVAGVTLKETWVQADQGASLTAGWKGFADPPRR